MRRGKGESGVLLPSVPLPVCSAAYISTEEVTRRGGSVRASTAGGEEARGRGFCSHPPPRSPPRVPCRGNLSSAGMRDEL
jgi:hypothetical protein